MKKALITATAVAFLGTSTLVPTSASAMFFLLPLVMLAKHDSAAKTAKPAKHHAKRHHAKKKMAKTHHKKSKKKM
jgi:hypothetical protein